jgi:hypothetical protein
LVLLRSYRDRELSVSLCVFWCPSIGATQRCVSWCIHTQHFHPPLKMHVLDGQQRRAGIFRGLSAVLFSVSSIGILWVKGGLQKSMAGIRQQRDNGRQTLWSHLLLFNFSLTFALFTATMDHHADSNRKWETQRDFAKEISKTDWSIRAQSHW